MDKWKEYKTKISKAVADYVPCKSTNCSCFTDLIVSDLLPFKDGITKLMVEKAKEKYHVHIVYRNLKFELIFSILCYLGEQGTKSLGISCTEIKTAFSLQDVLGLNTF